MGPPQCFQAKRGLCWKSREAELQGRSCVFLMPYIGLAQGSDTLIALGHTVGHRFPLPLVIMC